MQDNELILEQLRNNNPFASSYSPMPFENMTPDIAQLNRDASEEIEQLIRHKRREPNVPLAGLVFGAAGIGKTHMMTRILRKLRRNSWPAIFVTIRAFTNPKRVMHELFSEILICLNKQHSGGRSQFDVIIEGMMSAYDENRKSDGFSNISSIDRKIYLRRDMPGIDKNFLKCLLMYLDSESEAEKFEITEWLRDGLDDEDANRLGLPVRDIDLMDDAECERSAKNLLTSLGIVLSYAHIPMIICFDELDSIREKELIEAWGDTIAFIINHIDGILPLCFVKPETWETFKPIINISVLQRLRNNTIIMNGTCSPASARQIIHDRIANAFSEGAEEKYQWLISRMGDILTPGLSPRMVIELANKAIKTDLTSENFVKEIYDEEFKKIQNEPSAWPPNSSQLTLALEVWLKSLDGFDLKKGDGKYIKFFGIHGTRHFAFIVLTAKGHSTVNAALKSGISFMKGHPESQCFYITEAKTHKTSWKQVNETLSSFTGLGGTALILDKDKRVSWYALTALINRVDNGDVNVYSSSKPRPASRDDIMDFVKTLKLIDADTLKPQTNKSQHSHHTDEQKFLSVLSKLISSSPMKILAADKALGLMSQNGIISDRSELTAFVKKYSSHFKTFNSKNDILITLNDWRS